MSASDTPRSSRAGRTGASGSAASGGGGRTGGGGASRGASAPRTTSRPGPAAATAAGPAGRTPRGAAPDEPTQVLTAARTGTEAAGHAVPPSPATDDAAAPPSETGGRAGRRGRARTRKARLVLARVDPWSVMKLSFLLSIALAVILVTAVFVLWSVLDRLEVFSSLSTTIREVTESETNPGFDLMQYVGLDRVLGVAGVIACINIVLITALATLGAFLYNIATSLVGGLHVTLSEDA